MKKTAARIRVKVEGASGPAAGAVAEPADGAMRFAGGGAGAIRLLLDPTTRSADACDHVRMIVARCWLGCPKVVLVQR